MNQEDIATIEWPDVMLDLETMGTRPGDAVISIGAQLFDRKAGTLGPGYKINVDIEQVMDMGFGATGGTIKFWIEQNEAATKAALENPVSVHQALQLFADILTDDEGGVNNEIKVWGNGATFDNVLLRSMYERLGLLTPWKFWNDRCFRTMKAVHDPDKNLQPEFVGEKYDALADATHQAKWLINITEGRRVYGAADKEQLDMLDQSEAGHD